MPNDNMVEMCRPALNTGLPVLTVDTDSLTTATNLSRMNNEIPMDDLERAEKIARFVAAHIDLEWLKENLSRGYTRRLSPSAFRYQLVKLAQENKKRIVLPEVEVASSLAENLLQPQLKSLLKLADNYEVAEITVTTKIANKSLMELNMRKKFSLNVIAIERVISQELDEAQEEHKKVIGITDPNTVVLENDPLLVIGKDKNLKKFIDLNIA
jgi:K+/H+ antiporter YhaU regulatory subunit KhtT